jgi:GLPGLI family protein
MKKTIFFLASALPVMLTFTASAQQKTSGIVDYEITMQRNTSRQGSNGNNNNENDNDEGPELITLNRTFTFNAKEGKLSSPQFEGQANRPQNANRRYRGREANSEYIDFVNKKYIRAFKSQNNDTTFYIARDFRPAESFNLSNKTKKIAGYTCNKATARFRNNEYTIWFTKDIPLTFSPVNGLIPPDGGFVLALKSDRMEYKATNVQMKDVADNKVAIQDPSHQLTEAEIHDMRRKMMERRRGRQ